MEKQAPTVSYGDHAGSAGGLREGKGTVFEGGVRVPCVARLPGVLPAGSVCRSPLMTIDLFPTIAALVDPRIYRRLFWFIYGGTLGLLVIVLGFSAARGSQRWIPLPFFTLA